MSLDPTLGGLLGAAIGAAVTGVISLLAMRQQAEQAREAMEAQATLAREAIGVQLNTARDERSTRFRLAALDRRLDVPQKAYRLWIDLVHSLRDPQKAYEVVKRCEDFWYDNCLYLDRTSRHSFSTVTLLAVHYASTTDMKTREGLFGEFERAGRDLVNGVELEPVDGELQEVRPDGAISNAAIP